MPCLTKIRNSSRLNVYITKIGDFTREVVRWILFLLDSLFFLVVFGTAMGIPMMYAFTNSRQLLSSMHDMVSIYPVSGALFVVTSIESFILLVGIYGLIRKWEVYIGFKSVGLLVMMVVQFFILYSFYNECENNLAAALSMAVQHYNPNSMRNEHIDYVQMHLHCCGSSEASDYNIANEHFSKTHVPISCCSNSHSSCYNVTGARFDYDLPIEYAYKRGCYDVVENTVKPYFVVWAALLNFPGFVSLILSSVYCALVGRFPYPEDIENEETHQTG